jgi:hypothetical protein
MIWQGAATADIDGAFIPARAARVGFIDADGEAILLVETTNELHLLNSTAALLWQCFDGESSIDDICFDLADVLGLPFAQALNDTLEVVLTLVQQGVVYDGRCGPPDLLDGDASAPDPESPVPRPPGLLEEPPNN